MLKNHGLDLREKNLTVDMFLKDDFFNYENREKISYKLIESEEELNITINQDGEEEFVDWLDYVKKMRIERIEKELISLNNLNLIGLNIKLLNFLKVLVHNYKEFLRNSPFFKKNNNKEKYVSKNLKIFEIFKYYNNINYKKLKKLKNGLFYKNSEKVVIMVDIRPLKPRIFIMAKNKCLFFLTSGILYKRLNMKQKKIKKTEKMLNLMLKTISLKLSKTTQSNKFIIHLKGTRFNMSNILVLFDRHFKNKSISIMYSPHISYGKFKFKKIKSIKRRLRKKFSKLIKN